MHSTYVFYCVLCVSGTGMTDSKRVLMRAEKANFALY